MNYRKYITGKGKNVSIYSDINNRSKGRADGRNDNLSFKVKYDSGTSGYREVWGAINTGCLDNTDVKVLRSYGRIQSVGLPLTSQS